MFEFLTASKDDAISLLKQDHDKVKGLFDEFQKAESKREKFAIAKEAINELKIHAEIEEKVFYPSVRAEMESDVMNEANEEHHVAKLLIAELSQMDGSEEHWEAKFHVLSENIRHHIKEEEGDMFPKARKLEKDFEAIGADMLEMKAELQRDGVPPCDEELMMEDGIADSPARNAGDNSHVRLVRKNSNVAAPRKMAEKKLPASNKKAAASKAGSSKAGSSKAGSSKAGASKNSKVTPLKAGSKTGSKAGSAKKTATKSAAAKKPASKNNSKMSAKSSGHKVIGKMSSAKASTAKKRRAS